MCRPFVLSCRYTSSQAVSQFAFHCTHYSLICIQNNYELDHRLRLAVDPAVIVISPNAQSLAEVAQLFRNFMRFSHYVHGVVEAGITKQAENVIVMFLNRMHCAIGELILAIHSQVEIWNGCNILVCTPKILTDILEQNNGLLRNSKVIQHVVYDNINLIQKHFASEYTKIRAWHKKTLKSAQVVQTSRSISE